MKTKIQLIILILISFIANSQNSTKKSKDIFDLNSIKADQEYYSQAILQYQIIEKIISKYGNIYHLYPKEDPKLYLEKTNSKDPDFDINNGVPTMVLFPNAQDKSDINNEINKELSELGVDRCQYEIPLNLDDLDGGFQFNHYLFNSDNKAALDAFGIVKNGFESKSLYIVIDYLQHKDFNCTGLPKIRYGVGIRSEIKISGWNNKTELKESSLAGLAANAEINSLKVNITVKTIGITGLDSKLNIPNNTNFNVDTYADYQKIIDFIRTFKQNDETKEKKDSLNPQFKNIKFKPQIIPVMDEYRTSISESFSPYYSSLENLEKKIKKLSHKRAKYLKDKLSSKNDDSNLLDKISVDIYESKVNALYDEMKVLNDRKKDLTNANIFNTDLKRYVKLLSVINNTSLAIKNTEVENEVTTIKNKITTIKTKETNSLDQAKQHERDAFNFLFDKKLDDAITSFQLAENSYNGYNSVYEINRYLKSLPAKNLNWKLIYTKILSNYNYKLPTDIIEKLKNSN